MSESHQNIMHQFFGLANRLSPENLSCDGEISKAQVQVRYRQIMREWAALERRVGQKVSLEEVEEEQFKKWRSGMDNRKLSKELLFVAKSLLGTDFPSQEAFDKYVKDHPKANRSNHKVVKDPKDETPDEVEERMKKEKGPAYRTQEQRLEDAKPKHGPAQGDTKSVWYEMTPTQSAEAKSKDRQDAKEKAKKSAVASQLLFLAKEVIGMDFPTQDAFDKYMKEHPDANRSNHKVVKTPEKTPVKKDEPETEKKDGGEIKMPKIIGGKPTNEKAWGACVDMAKAQKAWGKKVINDKKWMDGVSEMSKEMARGYASKPLHEMAEHSYSYHQMRHEMGVKSTHPGAFGEDIKVWKQMTEKGTHPDLEVFK